MSLSILTPPTLEPVSLAEVKTFLRVDNTDEDEALVADIAAARDWVEERTGLRLMTQTWRWTVSIHWKHHGVANPSTDYETRVPERYGDRVIRYGMWIRHQPYLRFPLWPAQSISQITYRQNGSDVVYTGSPRVLPNGKIIFNPSDPPPLPDEQEDAITVDVVCGYGNSRLQVPDRYKRAIRMLCAHWYENRGIYIMSGSGERFVEAEMAASVTDLIRGGRKLSI